MAERRTDGGTHQHAGGTMPKLTTIKPKVAKLAPLMRAAYDNRDHQRDTEQHWRRWYKTSRWQRLRMAVLARDMFTCRMCGIVCAGKGEAVADHITPHRGDEALFWDGSLIQCLCKSCHDGVKAKQERQQGFR